MTRTEILRRLNKLSPFQSLVPESNLSQDEIEMPIELILRSIVNTMDAKPGENCKITDFVVTGDGVKMTLQRGTFSKETLAPRKAIDLFTDDAISDLE